MWIVILIVLAAGLLFIEIAKRRIPKVHAVIERVSWGMEALMIAGFVAALFYRFVAAQPL